MILPGGVLGKAPRPAVRVSVLVPFRPDGGWRDRSWQWVRARWAEVFPSWQVVVGGCQDGPWVKAHAVADALTRADGDVLVVGDSDVWTDGIADAVQAVADGHAWAVPHRLVHRLDQASTLDVLAGGPLGGTLTQRAYGGMVGGGVVVLSQGAYEACPLDPRFQGWGQEDQSWGVALTTMYGQPWRGGADLWHLHHEPQPRMSRSTGCMEGRKLARRYQGAAGDRDAMASLIEEARSACLVGGR